MYKKDLLLESFESKLQKTELKSIYGGAAGTGITQTTQSTPKIGGGYDDSDPKTDQEVAMD